MTLKALQLFRVSIRDLLWLTVVAAVSCGWWVEHRRLVPKIAALEAKASADALQIWFERDKRLTRLYETAQYVPLARIEVDDIIDTVLHDSSQRRAGDALRIVPLISDRQYAISFLLNVVNSRLKWDEGSFMPVQAVVCLAEMNAFEAIPVIDEFLHFLENEPVKDEEEQQACIRAVKKKLDQLKSRKERH
jgi:hypothetical protein